MAVKAQRIFLTGSTGYIGSRLIPILTVRGHQVTALIRKESRHKLPPHCDAVSGSALDGNSYAAAVEGADTSRHRSAANEHDVIFAAADRFTGNAPQHDDIRLLVIQLG